MTCDTLWTLYSVLLLRNVLFSNTKMATNPPLQFYWLISLRFVKSEVEVHQDEAFKYVTHMVRPFPFGELFISQGVYFVRVCNALIQKAEMFSGPLEKS